MYCTVAYNTWGLHEDSIAVMYCTAAYDTWPPALFYNSISEGRPTVTAVTGPPFN